MKRIISIIAFITATAIAFAVPSNVQTDTLGGNLINGFNTGAKTITAGDGGTITYSGTGTNNAKTLQTYTPSTLPVSTAAQTALDLKANAASASLTGTVTIANLAQAGSTTINYPTSALGATKELTFTTDSADYNVIALQNNSATGFGVVAIRDASGYEVGAWGYCPPGQGAPWGPDAMFLETNNHAPRPLNVVINGNRTWEFNTTNCANKTSGGLFLLPASGAGTITGSTSGGILINAAASGNNDIGLNPSGTGKIYSSGVNKVIQQWYGTSSGGYIELEMADAAGRDFKMSLSSGGQEIKTVSSLPLLFKTNDTLRVTIAAGGEISLNSTTEASAGAGALTSAGGIYAAKKIISGTGVEASTLTSSVATGTAPIVVSSTTLVANLHVATADAAPASGITGTTLASNVVTATIGTLTGLTSNGLVQTTGGTGALSVVTTTLPSSITGSSLTSTDTLTAVNTSGSVTTTVAGGTLAVKSGTNALAGTVTLSAGTATITSTAIDVNTVIVFSEKTAGGTPGIYQPLAAVSAGSAVVTSAATDTSTYNWVALKVN